MNYNISIKNGLEYYFGGWFNRNSDSKVLLWSTQANQYHGNISWTNFNIEPRGSERTKVTKLVALIFYLELYTFNDWSSYLISQNICFDFILTDGEST